MWLWTAAACPVVVVHVVVTVWVEQYLSIVKIHWLSNLTCLGHKSTTWPHLSLAELQYLINKGNYIELLYNGAMKLVFFPAIWWLDINRHNSYINMTWNVVNRAEKDQKLKKHCLNNHLFFGPKVLPIEAKNLKSNKTLKIHLKIWLLNLKKLNNYRHNWIKYLFIYIHRNESKSL